MSKLFYIDESGFEGDWVFTAVYLADPSIPKNILKKWRNWMRNHLGKSYNRNEYHHADATDAEKKKILTEIAKYGNKIQFWSVLRYGYNGNHKELYAPTVVELLRYCGVKEEDSIVAVDKVEKGNVYMEKHLKNIKKSLGMPRLDIHFEVSEREKGIQIADALAGATSIEFTGRPGSSFFEIVLDQMANDLKRIH